MRRTTQRALVVALALASAGGACAAAIADAGPAAAPAGSPRLAAAPTAVPPGGRLRLRGTGFPANAHLALLAGPPHGRTTQIGSAVTGSRGSFVATIRIRSRSAPGAFVALACHDACRVAASARFRIIRP